MKQFTLNQTYAKVLLTISELNKKSLYPLNEGVFKILTGVVDDETSVFTDIPSFGTLTSFSSKRICHLTLTLYRHGFLQKIFDPKTKKLYLKTTEKGEESLIEFFNNHQCSFAKRNQKSSVTIVKID